MSSSPQKKTSPATRKEYSGKRLLIENTTADPLEQFDRWFSEAVGSRTESPEAMTLATTDERGRPNARMVLLKSYGTDGFCFFTNLRSRKSKELAHTPYACLVFFWPTLDRQVRIQGAVERQSDDVDDAYFSSRPVSAQLASWASLQSQPIDEDTLTERMEAAKKNHREPIKRPPFWGGFRVLPTQYEFWQGQPNRLHDRIVYQYNGRDKAWSQERLAP